MGVLRNIGTVDKPVWVPAIAEVLRNVCTIDKPIWIVVKG